MLPIPQIQLFVTEFVTLSVFSGLFLAGMISLFSERV